MAFLKMLLVAGGLFFVTADSAMAQIEFRGVYLGMDTTEALSVARKISDTSENDDEFVFSAPIKLVNTKITVKGDANDKVGSLEISFNKRSFDAIKEAMAEKYGNDKFCSAETYENRTGARYSCEVCVWKLIDGTIYLNEKSPYSDSEGLVTMVSLKVKAKRKKSFWSRLGLW